VVDYGEVDVEDWVECCFFYIVLLASVTIR